MTHWKKIFKITIPYIICVGIFQWIAMLISGVKHNQSDINPFQFFTLSIFGFFGTVLIIWIFLKYVDKENFKTLGFQYFFIDDIKAGLLIGFLIMMGGFAFLLAIQQLAITTYQFNLLKILFCALSFISIALTEEILIRGYVLGNLMKSTNRYIALFLSSIIFSLMHLGNPNISMIALFELLLAGCLLGASYIYTKNLWFPIALHFSWNFFQGTLFGFNVSGFKMYSIIQQERTLNTVLNGGDFGFEGSILSIVLTLVCIIGVLIFFKAKEDVHTEE